MEKQRVVVLGAGVLGLFTAMNLLADEDCEITVLDKANPGDGSSGRSVGMVETQYFTKSDVEVRAFGRNVYSGLERNYGLSFEHGGYLRIARTSEEKRQFAVSLETQQQFGITDVELLSQPQMAERWPHLITDDLAGGLLGNWDGYVDGFEVCQLLSKIIRERKGVVKTNTAVTGAEWNGSEWRIASTTGIYEADVVVNAAGAHAGTVGDMLGAPVEVLPQLHDALTIKFPGIQNCMPFVMDYIPGSGKDGVYFRPEGPGHLVAGLHTDEVIAQAVDPDVLLRSVGDDILERIATLLMERLHNAENLALDSSWQGIYPMTPDYQPVVGLHPSAPGVVCALGAGGSGIQLAPAIGRLAAGYVRRAPKPAFEIARTWSADRFGATV